MTRTDPHPTQIPSFIQTGFTVSPWTENVSPLAPCQHHFNNHCSTTTRTKLSFNMAAFPRWELHRLSPKYVSCVCLRFFKTTIFRTKVTIDCFHRKTSLAYTCAYYPSPFSQTGCHTLVLVRSGSGVGWVLSEDSWRPGWDPTIPIMFNVTLNHSSLLQNRQLWKKWSPEHDGNSPNTVTPQRWWRDNLQNR